MTSGRPGPGACRKPSLFLAIAALFSASSCASPTAPPASAGPPHVFLLIGDGMGLETEILASRYLYGRDDGLVWKGFQFQAWATTWDTTVYDAHAASRSPAAPAYEESSADPVLGFDAALGGTEPWPLETADSEARLAYFLSAATDSASAATAMATGRKTAGGAIAWKPASPSGAAHPLGTIAELMRSRLGAAVGIVTTVPFNHATPAAFVSHSPSRNDYASIASQMLDVFRPEVLIGGGHPSWCGSYFQQAALDAARSSSRWSLVERVASRDGGAALAAAAASLPAGTGLFGLFGGADGAFEAPVPLDSPSGPSLVRNTENPSLAQAVLSAAAVLARDRDGFFLMAEQGDIDWANHANDLPRAIGAVASLDEAVSAVVAFVDRPGDDITWANSLLIVTADHATGLPRFSDSSAFAKGSLPVSRSGAAYSYASGELVYRSGSHGNELVTVSARGDRAEACIAPFVGALRSGTRIIDNTAVYAAIAAFCGF